MDYDYLDSKTSATLDEIRLRVAHALEKMGVVSPPPPRGF